MQTVGLFLNRCPVSGTMFSVTNARAQKSAGRRRCAICNNSLLILLQRCWTRSVPTSADCLPWLFLLAAEHHCATTPPPFATNTLQQKSRCIVSVDPANFRALHVSQRFAQSKNQFKLIWWQNYSTLVLSPNATCFLCVFHWVFNNTDRGSAGKSACHLEDSQILSKSAKTDTAVQSP